MKPTDRWESIKMQLTCTAYFLLTIFNDQTPLPLGIFKSLHGGGMDIFWNYTFEHYISHLVPSVVHGPTASW